MIPLAQTPDWHSLLTPQAARSEKSVIREMFKRLKKSDITSFAGGMPDTSLFPFDKARDTLNHIIEDKTTRVAALNYGPSEGYPPLREWIANHMCKLGANIDVENILVTSGGQQALDLICRAMLSPGDKVIVTAPTYLGALQILKSYNAEIISVPIDNEGPCLTELKAVLDQTVKFVYLVSDFSNPTGLSISMARRKAMIELAQHYRIPLVDDAAYQQLRFRGEPKPALIALDRPASTKATDAHLNEGTVIHIGTFSKTMMPGLRVGWIAAPATLINALHSYLPQNVAFTEPDGGMFVWLTLPEGSNSVDLLGRAMEQAKVAYIPGTPFFVNAEDGKRYCRLSYSGPSQEHIESGVKRLGPFLSRNKRGSD